MGATVEKWVKYPAFAVNPRGVLTHRVRSVDAIFYGDEPNHFHAHFWCGNGFNFEAADGILTDTPPADRLLCAICELKAVAKGRKTADKLAGHHVHIGHLMAVRDCCKSEKN